MNKSEAYGALVAFAEQRLNATAYADCSHRFALCECTCGSISFGVTIERHTHDTPGDFHGILRTRCRGCGRDEQRLSILSGGAAKILSSEQPRCECGSDALHIGLCERWEDWGFFDKGTVVAMCSSCGATRALVDTD